MTARASLADLRAEVQRTRPVRKAPKLDQAPGNLTRAEVVPDRGKLAPAREAGERVQKNLRIFKNDADRMVRLSRAAKISQTLLLALALDAYEASIARDSAQSNKV